MYFNRLLIICLLSAALTLTSFSQTSQASNPPDTASYPYWIEMMQDPSANFYDVQRVFNIYWKDRPVTRSSGFKPFKRWEYMMQLYRINPDGTRRPADHAYNEYQKYLTSHPGARSLAGDWINLGPFIIPEGKGYKGLGRLNAVAFDPSDPDIIWVGSPSGGLWKTTTGGNSWESTTDNLPSLGVSAILIDYVNPDIIYIGTGDRDAGDADGMGVFRSTDGGQTWEPWKTGMGNRVVGRLLMHPTSNQQIFAATSGGIYRSNTGGSSWSLVISGNFKDIVFKADNTDIMFAASGGNFYRSTNGGFTFSQVTNGLPGGDRAVIGVTPADPEMVYFLITNGDSFKALYRSTDAGLSFTMRSNSPNIMSWGCTGGDGGQAWYDLDIAIDPENENIIYAGGVNCFKSTNGGMNWNIVSHWWGDCGVPAVHADLHVLEWNPLDGRLYAGNDGGVYFTGNGGINWTEISNGLPISQVYKIGQSATVRDKCVNGYQDNGSSTYLGSYWQVTGGGDGMECAVDQKDAAYSYHTVYFGSIYRNYNNSYQATVCENGAYGIDESGSWITPFILDELNPNTMFVGLKNIWRCDNVKAPASQITWSRISYNLGSTNTQDMRALEQSPANTDILYISRYDNKLYRTDEAHDITVNWVDLTSLLPSTGGVVDMECHPTNPDIVYISQNNKIFKSTDRGLTWENITGTLPNVTWSSIAYYKNSHEGLYISSNIGVYYRDQFMSDWIMFSDGLPVDASINEIEIYYDSDDPAGDIIRAGTYGRGMWESDMYHAAPVADFSASETFIPVGCAVDFTDLSSGIPTSWTWTFEGASPQTSLDRNPIGISYTQTGTFEVKLLITNEAGADSIIRTGFITVSDTILPQVGFSADQASVCVNGIVHFSDTSLYCPSSWEWSFTPGSISFKEGTTANSQNPIVEFRVAGTYDVTLIVTNSNGQSVQTKEKYIMAGGYDLPFFEDFESGSFEDRSWTVNNPDLGYTWQNYTIEQTGNRTARMKFYGYFGLGERDQLITPYLNFQGYDEVYLTFDHAYAQRFSQKDSLIIYISEDCNDIWTRLLAVGPDGQGAFVTSPPTPYEFIPASEADWCGGGYGTDCYVLNLSAWADQSGVRIMFESFNNLGNNLYLDNIQVSNTTSAPEINTPEGILNVYPNPGKGLFTIEASGMNGPVNIEVINTQGQSVLNETINISNSRFNKAIDLRQLSKGIYLVKLSNDEKLLVRKIMLE